MGHSSCTITKNIYGRNIKGYTENFANVLGEALDPIEMSIQNNNLGLKRLQDGSTKSARSEKIYGATNKTESRTYGTDR